MFERDAVELSNIMCLYVYVPKIDASESLGIALQNAADLG